MGTMIRSAWKVSGQNLRRQRNTAAKQKIPMELSAPQATAAVCVVGVALWAICAIIILGVLQWSEIIEFDIWPLV